MVDVEFIRSGDIHRYSSETMEFDDLNEEDSVLIKLYNFNDVQKTVNIEIGLESSSSSTSWLYSLILIAIIVVVMIIAVIIFIRKKRRNNRRERESEREIVPPEISDLSTPRGSLI